MIHANGHFLRKRRERKSPGLSWSVWAGLPGLLLVLCLGCREEVPERPVVSNKLPRFELASFTAILDENGRWELRTNQREFFYPAEDGDYMFAVPVESATPEKLPATMMFTMQDSNGITYGNGALFLQKHDDGTVEYVHDVWDLKALVNPPPLTSRFWFVGDDDDPHTVSRPARLR